MKPECRKFRGSAWLDKSRFRNNSGVGWWNSRPRRLSPAETNETSGKKRRKERERERERKGRKENWENHLYLSLSRHFRRRWRGTNGHQVQVAKRRTRGFASWFVARRDPTLVPPVSPIIHHGHVFNNASKKKYRDTVIRRVDRRQIDRMQQAQVTMVATSRLPKILSAPGTRELANQGHDSHAISRSGQHRGSCFYRSVLRRFPRCSRSHFSSDDFSRFFLSLSLSFLNFFFLRWRRTWRAILREIDDRLHCYRAADGIEAVRGRGEGKTTWRSAIIRVV